MTAGAKFVVWQRVLTDHQAHTLASLARQSGRPIVAYVTCLEDAARKAQGWTDTTVLDVERRLLSPHLTWRDGWRHLIEHRNDAHIFCSPFDQPVLILCLLAASRLCPEVYLVSEPYSPNADGYLADTVGLIPGLKAQLRPLVYRTYGCMLRGRLAGVFAIGRLAVEQYRRAGMDPSRIFPFGYFVPGGAPPVPGDSRPENCALRLAFVGNLIRRKGVHELVAAMRQVRGRGLNAQLDVYGSGDPSAFEIGGDGVRYCGVVPFGQAQAVMSKYDLVVLPSRYDGWGVVVNEALCAGVPVLCSRGAGASVLVETFGAGLTFPAGDAAALADAIATVALDPAFLQGMRAGARLAAQAIQPEMAAAYMLSVVSAEPGTRCAIPSPWYGGPR